MFSAHPTNIKGRFRNNTGVKLSPVRNEGSLSNKVAQGVVGLAAEIYRRDCHGLKAFTER